MSGEVKHTPTPWKQIGRTVEGGEYETEAMNVSLSGNVGKPNLVKSHAVRFTLRNEEDAEFIVRAVNSHDDNQKTIQILRRMLEKATGWDASEISKEIAIAKAEATKCFFCGLISVVERVCQWCFAEVQP